MYPPIFATCFADSTCKAKLGGSPMRLYPFGKAPQDESRPYAVWQLVTGLPENCIDSTPVVDTMTTQVDVYATTGELSRSAAEAIRDAVESVAYVTRWRGEMQDDSTELYRYSFDVEWIVSR